MIAGVKMPITRQDFGQLREHYLVELIAEGVAESSQLDFNEKTYGTSDSDKRELLRNAEQCEYRSERIPRSH